MTDPRYEKRKIIKTPDPVGKRDLVSHFSTANLKRLSDEQLSQLTVKTEFWKTGDMFWKFAAKYYNNQPDLWWVIALFNESPTEHHMFPGKPVMIPFPLEKVLKFWGF